MNIYLLNILIHTTKLVIILCVLWVILSFFPFFLIIIYNNNYNKIWEVPSESQQAFCLIELFFCPYSVSFYTNE